jgi:hypothetical protein
MKTPFLNWANNFEGWKVQNICTRGWECDNPWQFLKTAARPWPLSLNCRRGSLNPSVTSPWQACCITRFFASKFGHCPTSPFLARKFWYFHTRRQLQSRITQ